MLSADEWFMLAVLVLIVVGAVVVIRTARGKRERID